RSSLRSVEQQLLVEPGRRRHDLAVVVEPVQAQHAVEVQGAAALKLSDLDVRHARSKALLAHASQPSELARKLDRRSPPQFGRERVPQDRVLVVEAVRANRLAEALVALVMHERAPDRNAVRAGRAVSSRPAPSRLAVDYATRVHRPEA